MSPWIRRTIGGVITAVAVGLGAVAVTDNDGSSGPAPTTASAVSIDGITYTFSASRPVGQFVTGDWWVDGPVTITAMSPAFSAGNHGWQVNPNLIDNKLTYGGVCVDDDCGSQSLDSQAFHYTAPPALPYTANPGESVVKVISQNPDSDCGFETCLEVAAVLTVLDTPPPNNGTNQFRPPYMGTDKPLYSVDDMEDQFQALPDLASTAAIDPELPTQAQAIEAIKRPNISTHIQESSMFQALLNVDSPDDMTYAPEIAATYATSVLRGLIVKGGDSEGSRRQLMIDAVQRGIDVIGAKEMGMNYYAAGGVNHGYMLPAVLAAFMLDNQDMKDLIAAVPQTGFQETGEVSPRQHGGPVLWGHDRGEDEYWSDVEVGADNGTNRDPYGYIDGGSIPGGRYETCCTLNVTKAYATVVHLIGMEDVWDDPNSLEIVERYVTDGVYTQPDPCAPVSQGGGPHPTNTGQCVLDPNLTVGQRSRASHAKPASNAAGFRPCTATSRTAPTARGSASGFAARSPTRSRTSTRTLGRWRSRSTRPISASTGYVGRYGFAFTTNRTVASNAPIVVDVGWYTATAVTLASVSSGNVAWTFNPNSALVSAPAEWAGVRAAHSGAAICGRSRTGSRAEGRLVARLPCRARVAPPLCFSSVRAPWRARSGR